MIWKRAPEHDRRIRRGDDFAGDAWVHVETGEIRWTAVGQKIDQCTQPSGENP